MMLFLLGTELRAEREALGVDELATLAAICGVRVQLLEEFEAGRYAPSEALQRELLMALQSVDTVRQVMPGLDLHNAHDLTETVLRLYDGYYSGYRRDPDERAIGRKQIEAAGEAATA